MADWRVYVYFAHLLFKYICVSGRTAQTRSYNLTAQVLQTSQVSRASLYLIHPGPLLSVASLTARNIAMMFEHIYSVVSFIVMLIVLLCVFKMFLALTATCISVIWHRDLEQTFKATVKRATKTRNFFWQNCRRTC